MISYRFWLYVGPVVATFYLTNFLATGRCPANSTCHNGSATVCQSTATQPMYVSTNYIDADGEAGNQCVPCNFTAYDAYTCGGDNVET